MDFKLLACLSVHATRIFRGCCFADAFVPLSVGPSPRKGKFEETFRSVGKPTVRSVAEILAKDWRFSGFENEAGKAILGDLLLTGVLERAALGRS